MQTTSVTRASLRRLLGLRPGGHGVLSLYLDLDPNATPSLRDRHAEVDSLLEEADRRYVQNGREGTHEMRMALRADLKRVREFLTDDELSPDSAHGLAIFCCEGEIVEVVRLPRAVEPQVVVADTPFIEPLAELAVPGRWCVAVVSRRASRIFRGTRDRLREVGHVRDDVHGRHDQGGWSQARYQRGIEKEVDDHVRGTCERLHDELRRRPFERMLLAGPHELHHRVERQLHPDLRARLAGHFEVDVERASPDEVHRRALPLIEADERRDEQAALARLREGLGPGGHASAGLDEVLELLDERRVQTLLLAHGFAARGFACPRCGWLAAGAGSCPTHDAELAACDDVVERSIEAAIEQDADVLLVRHEPDSLERLGSIAALIRY